MLPLWSVTEESQSVYQQWWLVVVQYKRGCTFTRRRALEALLLRLCAVQNHFKTESTAAYTHIHGTYTRRSRNKQHLALYTYIDTQGPGNRGGSEGVGPPLESGIYVVKIFLKIFLIYSDPPWIKIVPRPLYILDLFFFISAIGHVYDKSKIIAA